MNCTVNRAPCTPLLFSFIVEKNRLPVIARSNQSLSFFSSVVSRSLTLGILGNLAHFRHSHHHIRHARAIATALLPPEQDHAKITGFRHASGPNERSLG
jgi:hypothetical protein